MRKLTIICAGLLVAACASGRGVLKWKDIAVGTNTSATATQTDVRGYIEDISVRCTDNASGCTTTVSLVSAGLDTVTLATATVSSNKVWRPFVQFTDSAGVTNTTQYRPRFILGEAVRTSITESPTGKVWRIMIKTTE